MGIFSLSVLAQNDSLSHQNETNNESDDKETGILSGSLITTFVALPENEDGSIGQPNDYIVKSQELYNKGKIKTIFYYNKYKPKVYSSFHLVLNKFNKFYKDIENDNTVIVKGRLVKRYS